MSILPQRVRLLSGGLSTDSDSDLESSRGKVKWDCTLMPFRRMVVLLLLLVIFVTISSIVNIIITRNAFINTGTG